MLPCRGIMIHPNKVPQPSLHQKRGNCSRIKGGHHCRVQRDHYCYDKRMATSAPVTMKQLLHEVGMVLPSLHGSWVCSLIYVHFDPRDSITWSLGLIDSTGLDRFNQTIQIHQTIQILFIAQLPFHQFFFPCLFWGFFN